MWLVFSTLSIIFYMVAWILFTKRNVLVYWASTSSLICVTLALVFEYKMVLDWVNLEDWAALLDVIPSVFPILTSYVLIMFLANAILLSITTKKIKFKEMWFVFKREGVKVCMLQTISKVCLYTPFFKLY